jgi:menaquinone-dependent protoporphyrinogen oxidase
VPWQCADGIAPTIVGSVAIPSDGTVKRRMSARVLVAYGSRGGATAELASWLADELRAQGCVIRIHSAGAVDDLRGFDAVVLGGPIYLRRWHSACRDFVRQHRSALCEMPVWLFSSGPLESVDDANEPLPVAYVRATLRGLPARGHRTFGGRLTADAGGLAGWWLARGGSAGDYRDESRVRDWAASIADELAAPTRHHSSLTTAAPLKAPAARSLNA